jgi:hypothetical protein
MNNTKFVVIDKSIFINVEIILPNSKEKKEVPMLLDTGAKYNIIDSSLLKKLGYDLNLYHSFTFRGFGSKDLIGKEVKISSMKLHKLKRTNVSVIAYDMPLYFLQYCFGIIGLDFLRNQIFTIDLKNNEFHFS